MTGLLQSASNQNGLLLSNSLPYSSFQEDSEMNKTLYQILMVIVLFTAPLPVLAESEPPEISLEGLELVEKDRRGEIYADPGIDWSVYTQIQLDTATVAFRKNWQRDQNRYQHFKVRADDMEKIKSSLSELFDEVFTEELTVKGGYEIGDGSGDNVMRITPHIVDLDVHAPDTMTAGTSRSYTEQAGRMTLKLEIYDSITGDLIATASHRQEAPRRGYMLWTSSVSNRAEARRMLQRWATGLRERLDDARNAPAAGG
jgi:hypothetical protein